MACFLSILFCVSSLSFGSQWSDIEISDEGSRLISSFRDFLLEFSSEEHVQTYFSDIKIIAEKNGNLEKLQSILQEQDKEKQKRKMLKYAMKMNHRNIVLFLFLKEKALIPSGFLKKERHVSINPQVLKRSKKRNRSLTLPIDSLVERLRPYGVYSKDGVWGWSFAEKKDPMEIFYLYSEFQKK